MYVEGLAPSKVSTDIGCFCDDNIHIYQGFFARINNTVVSKLLYMQRIFRERCNESIPYHLDVLILFLLKHIIYIYLGVNLA